MHKQLLIIGKPHSSKTVFLTQLYSRLQKKKSKLTLYKAVENLSTISAAREALAIGEEPKPTNTEKSDLFYLPIQTSDLNQTDLLCPEYGGEQINGIIDGREISTNWAKAIDNSDNWIFFIRLNSINQPKDISTIEVTKENTPVVDSNESEYSISDQSSLIELLQFILHHKGYNYHTKNTQVKLLVVLTCWDELETMNNPEEVINSRLPLLLNFIETNWDKQFFKIIGLSALGFPLNSLENKEKYQIEGPECFGFLVKENGETTEDITELILEAL
ncbi:MAG: hypothetical protein KUL78_07960 [Flavobacterium sp.]|nr:hypothetical protein [Flavobacterium sp.]